MNTEQTTEPRDRMQIEDEFIPAISTIKAINDFLFVATGASDMDIEALHEETICSLANRCLIEAENVKGLFYELMDLYMEKKEVQS